MSLVFPKLLKQELLERSNLNIAELDNVPCAKCGKIPPIKKTRDHKGKIVIDRSSRYDCDGGGKKEKLETYHVACWKELISE